MLVKINTPVELPSGMRSNNEGQSVVESSMKSEDKALDRKPRVRTHLLRLRALSRPRQSSGTGDNTSRKCARPTSTGGSLHDHRQPTQT